MTEKLKPCPFCGGSNVVVQKTPSGGKTKFSYSVVCEDCWIWTDMSDIEAKVINVWNRRANDNAQAI